MQVCAGPIGNTERSLGIQGDRNHTCKGKDECNRITYAEKFMCFHTRRDSGGKQPFGRKESLGLSLMPYMGAGADDGRPLTSAPQEGDMVRSVY